ncbi:hypothetical protein B0H11DRAFT_1908195 [Mycena galericulata]|nr:hypothetical protein B0H11DRAFT_1908195 [Mycena galericulata]
MYSHYSITKNAAAAVRNWRSKFGKIGLKAVAASLETLPTIESRADYVANELLDSTRTRKMRHTGAYRSELILRIFAAHLHVVLKTDIWYGHPVGALAISCAAAERVLQIHKTGACSSDGIKRKVNPTPVRDLLITPRGHLLSASTKLRQMAGDPPRRCTCNDEDDGEVGIQCRRGQRDPALTLALTWTGGYGHEGKGKGGGGAHHGCCSVARSCSVVTASGVHAPKSVVAALSRDRRWWRATVTSSNTSADTFEFWSRRRQKVRQGEDLCAGFAESVTTREPVEQQQKTREKQNAKGAAECTCTRRRRGEVDPAGLAGRESIGVVRPTKQKKRRGRLGRQKV